MQEEMKRDLAAQTQLLKQCRQELETLPNGRLIVRPGRRRNYYCQWLNIEGKAQVRYLSPAKPEEWALIERLQRKRLLQKNADALAGNVKALALCLETYRPLDPAGACGAGESWTEERRTAWSRDIYQRSTMNPEGLMVSTVGGLWVRSKSEALIAFALDLAGVPFHYEEVLLAGETKMAPDFTLRHPVSGEKFYWEHFGMMEDELYAAEAFKKLQRYAAMGIFPGRQLILTMETKAWPLGLAEIRRIIDVFFLR